jgi:hypothetical protein
LVKVVCFDRWAKKENWVIKDKLANTSKLIQVYTISASFTELTQCKIVCSRVYI